MSRRDLATKDVWHCERERGEADGAQRSSHDGLHIA